MSYLAGIVEAITAMKDRTGSSMISIKKHMQEKLPKVNKSFIVFENARLFGRHERPNLHQRII